MEDKLIMVGIILILIGPMAVALLIASLIDKKYGKRIREKMERQHRAAQKAGGFSAIHYRSPKKRAFNRIYVTAIWIGMAITLAIFAWLFSKK